MKNSKSRFGYYIAVFCTLINNLLIIVVLNRQGWWSAGWSISCLNRLVGRRSDFINTLLIIVLYRHGIKFVLTKVKYVIELKDRVLASEGPLSISAVAELVST